MYKNMIKQLVKKAAVGGEQRLDKITARDILITNVGLLKNAVDEISKLFSDKVSLVNSGSFVPSAREQWANYQAIVYSTAGIQVIPSITENFSNNNFMFCFVDQVVHEDKIHAEKKTVLGLNSIVRGNKIETKINGGWFLNKNPDSAEELCFAIVVPKPNVVFNRYTMLQGVELGMKPDDYPDQDPNPALLYYPVVVMDEYTRSLYSYPRIFAKEFYTAVMAKYCSQSLDKYIVPKTEYNMKVPRGKGEPDEDKKYALAALPFSDTEINLRNMQEIYELQVPFIQRELSAACGGYFRDISNRAYYPALSEEALRPLAYDEGDAPEIDTTAIEQEIQELRRTIAAETDDDEIAAGQLRIEQLQQQIDMASAAGGGTAIPIVFRAGQPVNPNAVGTRAREARSPDKQTAVNNLLARAQRNSSSRMMMDKIKMNLSSYWQKSVAVNYRPIDAPVQAQSGEFQPEPRVPGGQPQPTYAFSLEIKMGGNAIYVPPQGAAPARVDLEPEKSPATVVDFDPSKIEKVTRAVEVVDELELLFKNVLKASTTRGIGKTVATKEIMKYQADTQSIRARYQDDIVRLNSRISDIVSDSHKYHFTIPTSKPELMKYENGKQVMKSHLEYVIALDSFLAELESVSPKPLDAIETMLEEGKRISEADLSIIRIILEENRRR